MREVLDGWRNEQTPRRTISSAGQKISSYEEVRELEISMGRWGLDPEQDARHNVFWTLAKTLVSDYVEGKGLSMLKCHALEAMKPDELRERDRLKAIDGFLDDIVSSVADDDFEIVHDLLLERHPHLPFVPPYGWDMKLVTAYQHIPKCKFDPLSRFLSYPVEDNQEKLSICYEGQKAAYNYNNPTLLAMVAHHMTFSSTRCLKCMTFDTLRWNRALDARWRRILCVQCGSLYAFFPKTRLRIKLKNGTSISPGPRFDVFYSVLRELRKKHPNATMFGVFFDNEAIDEPLSTRDVFAAEIRKVLPFLKPESFCGPPHSLNIYTKMLLKNIHPWFTLLDYPVDAKDLVGRTVDWYNDGIKKNEDQKSIDTVQQASFPTRQPEESLADLELRIRSLRRTRNRMEDNRDPASVECKACVLKELKECEDRLRDLL